MRYISILASLLVASLTSCTQNQRAKSIGGTAKVDLPIGTKLVSATWKDTQLWYLYRPAREGEQPETVTLQEESSYGVWEGKVIFQEHAVTK